MLMITLYPEQKKRHRFIEQSFVSFLLETDPKNNAMIHVLHIFLQKFYSI